MPLAGSTAVDSCTCTVTACWLPFFVLAVIKPFCTDAEKCSPHWLGALFLWLGYANSFLNPIIYARFNREFRTPFKEILLLRCRAINTRLRTETYAEQFGLILPGGAGAGVGNLRALWSPRCCRSSGFSVLFRTDRIGENESPTCVCLQAADSWFGYSIVLEILSQVANWYGRNVPAKL